uniref:Uncharacterized protein LOC114331724 n=1 Tax=Diabrotica virgifera virgifera TaxID=50390 RepID=A0A6P7FW56_DIAVI
MDLGSHSRNSSVSGSLVSQNSTRYVKNRRRDVGDRVTITSDSKVYLNTSDNNDVDNKAVNNRENKAECDTDFNKVGDLIRTSKDLPKLKNKIFEDSIESQEISFYIGGAKFRH